MTRGGAIRRCQLKGFNRELLASWSISIERFSTKPLLPMRDERERTVKDSKPGKCFDCRATTRVLSMCVEYERAYSKLVRKDVSI